MSMNPRVSLMPIRALYIEGKDLKGRMSKLMEFLSFDADLLYRVAEHILLKEATTLGSSLRLVFLPQEKAEKEIVLYDAKTFTTKKLVGLSDFPRFSFSISSISDVNDELRNGYGFSTHDIPVSPDELHALRTCLPSMPKVHSAWIRGELKYLLFYNCVLARRC